MQIARKSLYRFWDETNLIEPSHLSSLNDLDDISKLWHMVSGLWNFEGMQMAYCNSLATKRIISDLCVILS